MSSATSPLVSVPRKTTSEVDYSSAIKQVISTTYGEPPDRYNEEIANLNRARQDAVRGAAGSDMTARDLLYRYFGQLELLELRFPDLRVPFPWNDAFIPSKNISQLSLAYEKASVIFNIAATLSALAAAQNRSSPEGLKRAFNFYRSSAGMFTYINDNFLHAPSTDLGRDLIKILVSLMTAQATEVFLERMNEEKRSPGLKSKICAQIASLYNSIIEDVKENVGKGYFDRSWLVVVQVSRMSSAWLQ
jgi:tyrosine-protein phosphatase non-receptor type 23